MNIKIVVTGEFKGKEVVLSEVERELEMDFESDPYDRGTKVVLFHPDEDLGLKAINDAEDYLNQNPELWGSVQEEPDYSGPDDPTGQYR